ncbi:GNAT family N-acetyltransferase [Kaistia sp. UC242_56]|uniref:GNAT family N-acetyltransferase n=1 Tax=Kaistia sp. UC242_56 TaxID=3374625 RepID=UPI0037A90750
MTVPHQYSFRKATIYDLPLLAAWQSNPHVRAWWGSGEPYSAADLADPRVARWIVSTRGRPFAFMQDYTVHGWEDHHFFKLPNGSRGIDQFIGEPKMMGLGHGSAFIGARMRALFDFGVPVIATDPHPANERAIAVYKKLGFEPIGSPQETRWGLILPMVARR